MNKKGVLMVYTMIFTIMAVSLSIGLFFWIESREFSFEIGEPQTKIIKSYMEFNNIKYYLKNNLRDSSENSIDNILNNAGMKEPISKEEYILWKKGNIECFPDDWEKLKGTLASEINKDIGKNISFSIFRRQNNLSIKAEVPISVINEGENYKIDYSESYENEFLIEDFNFDDFLNKASDIRDISNSCSLNESCWNSELSKSDKFAFIEVRDKLFKFEFTTKGLNQNVRIKVAIDLEEEFNAGEEELKC